jgi:lysozyme family protein
MVASTYDFGINRIIHNYEGGYVNHPDDPGGETIYGITKAVARANGYDGPMKEMPLRWAYDIYKAKYAKPVWYDSIEAGKDFSILDYGINSGPSRPIRVAQAICRLPQTGKMDPTTVTAINACNPETFINTMNDERLVFMKSLKGGAMWQTFGKGWGSRVADTRRISVNMNKNETKGRPPVEKLPTPRTNPKDPTPKAQHTPNGGAIKTGAGTVVAGGGASGAGAAQSKDSAAMWSMVAVGIGIAVIGAAVLILYLRHVKKKNEKVVLPAVLGEKDGGLVRGR